MARACRQRAGLSADGTAQAREGRRGGGRAVDGCAGALASGIARVGDVRHNRGRLAGGKGPVAARVLERERGREGGESWRAKTGVGERRPGRRDPCCADPRVDARNVIKPGQCRPRRKHTHAQLKAVRLPVAIGIGLAQLPIAVRPRRAALAGAPKGVTVRVAVAAPLRLDVPQPTCARGKSGGESNEALRPVGDRRATAGAAHGQQRASGARVRARPAAARNADYGPQLPVECAMCSTRLQQWARLRH